MRSTRSSAVRSLLVGGWAALWTVLPFALYGPLRGTAAGDWALEAATTPALAMNRMLGLDWDNVWVGPFVLVWAATTTISGLLLWLIAKLDVERFSAQALRWVLRTLPCMSFLLVVFACSIGLAALLGQLSEAAGWLALLLPASCLGLVPYICLRGDVIASERPPLLWTPRWPGITASLLTVLALVLSAAFTVIDELILSAAQAVGAAWLWFFAAVAGWIAGLYIAGFALGHWLENAPWHRRLEILRRYCGRDAVLAMAACDLRLLWLEMFIAGPPVLAAAFDLMFVAPTSQQALATHHQTIPTHLSLWWICAHWFVSWWWVCLLLPLLWIGLAARARTLWLSTRVPVLRTTG